MWWTLLVLVLVPPLLLWWVLPARLTGAARLKRAAPLGQTARTLVVLGSGGHTSEMLALLRHLDTTARYKPLTFVLAETDRTSMPQARARDDTATLAAAAEWVRITRSREVGQAWLSTVASTARAWAESVRVVFQRRPDIVLCNGPGVCVPVCLAALLLRLPSPAWRRPTVVFCESFCRVRSLSMTGRLLYYVADRFVVHWPELQRRYPRSEYLGQIY